MSPVFGGTLVWEYSLLEPGSFSNANATKCYLKTKHKFIQGWHGNEGELSPFGCPSGAFWQLQPILNRELQLFTDALGGRGFGTPLQNFSCAKARPKLPEREDS